MIERRPRRVKGNDRVEKSSWESLKFPGCPAGACLVRQSPTTNTRNFDEEPVWTRPERHKLAMKPITWKDGRSARELAGRRVRLFFEVRDPEVGQGAYHPGHKDTRGR